MTNSPRSASKKLQLTSLFRWLAVLCFIKLAIFTMILLDVPFPFLDQAITSIEKDLPGERRTKATPVLPKDPPIAPLDIATGTDAHEEKHTEQAAIKPTDSVPVSTETSRQRRRVQDSILAPAIEEKTKEEALLQTDLPLPAPLPAPIAEPGTELPAKATAKNEIPVPTLGSVTAAQAAQSMPLPKASPSSSPFAPMEQQAPLTRPGVPDMPRQNMPQSTQAQPGLGQRMPSPMPTPNGLQAPSISPSQPSLAPGGRPSAQPPMPGNATAPANSMQMNTEAQELARQQQDMLMLKKQMDERMKELQDSENKVKRMLEEAKTMEDQKIRALIQMYANMKPKTAAKALESMDERTACQILQRMTPKQSGDILSYTNPTVTAKLTELLARMRIQ